LSAIHAIFWDVGGVLLTNAWDRVQRMSALERFHLDEEEFHDRHEMVISSFERGVEKTRWRVSRPDGVLSRAPLHARGLQRFHVSLSQPLPDVLNSRRGRLPESNKYFHGHNQ